MQLQYLKAINRLVVARVEQKKNTDIYIFTQNHDFIIFFKHYNVSSVFFFGSTKIFFSISFTRHTCPQTQFSIM